MSLFKIWTRNRNKKTFVLVTDGSNMCENLILKANEKLQINGHRLVLEKDGTTIDEDDILTLLKEETMMLLEPGEEWVSASVSSSDTESVASSVLSNDLQDSDSGHVINDNELNNSILLDTPNTVIVDLNNVPIIMTNENVWHDFVIPWDKLPSHMLQACEEGKREKQIITEIIQTIVNEMRQIKTTIPAKAFKTVARKMVNKYPQTFKDYDEDGTVIGEGIHSVYYKLQDRNNYLNRPHKRKFENGFSIPSVPPKKAKKVANLRAGCSNWAPNLNDSNSNLNSKEILLNTDKSDPCFWEYLKQTYPEQRKFFNNIDKPPSIKDVQTEWPVLLDPDAMYWHFKQLTGVTIKDIPTEFEKKTEKIIKFGKKKKIAFEENEEVSISCLKILCSYFKESVNKICCKDSSTVVAPCVIVQNENYLVAMEGTIISKEISKFVDAFTMTFALYFIMNLQYPKDTQYTMETIQRYIFKIHPDKGTKSPKASKDKILKLISKFSQLD